MNDMIAHGSDLVEVPMSATIRYDEMCRSIAKAYAVLNVEAERQACEIRLRAERRPRQLLKQREKAKGAAQPGVGCKGAAGMPSSDTTALSEFGISRAASTRCPAVIQ